jgi:hypothetical protein
MEREMTYAFIMNKFLVSTGLLLIVQAMLSTDVRPAGSPVEQFQLPLVKAALQSLAATRENLQSLNPKLARIAAAHKTLTGSLGEGMPDTLRRGLGLAENTLDDLLFSYKNIEYLIDTTQDYLEGKRGIIRYTLMDDIDRAERSLDGLQESLALKNQERTAFKSALGKAVDGLIERHHLEIDDYRKSRDELDPGNFDRAIADQKKVLEQLRETIAALK